MTQPAQAIVAGRDFAVQEPGAEPSASLAALRRRIAAIERQPFALKSHPAASPWNFGISTIDKHLPAQGLSANALHEITAAAYADTPAAMGFALCLALRRLENCEHPLLWCRLRHGNAEWGRLYGHGLLALGLPRNRLLTVSLAKPKSLLWVLEEALRSKVLAAVIAEVQGRTLDLTRMRRLSLAAEAGSTPGLLVFPHPWAGATAALSRWQVKARASIPPPFDDKAPGSPAWDLVLERCRSGSPGEWSVEWTYATHSFSVVAPVSRGTSESHLAAGRPFPSERQGPSLRTG